MSDDAKGTQIPLSTDPIARLMWADIVAAQERGPLTFEIVPDALNRALITHLQERARQAKAPH